MRIFVICDSTQREELTCTGIQPGVEISWHSDIAEADINIHADALIDLSFEKIPERIEVLKKFSGLVIINSVVHTLNETDASFVRINAWNTFLRSPLIEAAASSSLHERAETIMSCFHKNLEWLPDAPGFITPRVISMIINEANLSLNEGVSSKDDINTAMKLGTNYPYGPFEWEQIIGKEKISALIAALPA